MKRALLVFPPKANPTYAPLGLASLVGFLKREQPGLEVLVRDLNLESWCFLAEQAAGGPAMMAFHRGHIGNFFNENSYLKNLTVWGRAAGRLAEWGVEAGRAALAPEASVLVPWLDRQARTLVLAEPDLVGISAVFPDQVPFALALASRVKHWGQQAGRPPRVVVGGASTSALDCDELLHLFPRVDGVLQGEGEAGLAALCSGAPADSVPGLVHRTDSGIRHNRRSALPLARLPLPDFGALPLARYLNPRPVLSLVGSRGCLWHRCRFCSHNASFGRHRALPAAAYVDEIEALQALHGVDHFYLTDENMPAPMLAAICEEVQRRALRISFHVLARPTEDFTQGLLDHARAAGCVWISWGVESGSGRLLDLAGKGTEPRTVKRVLLDAHHAGISNLAMMIFGLPGGTDSDLEQTLRLLEDVYPALDAVSASAYVLFQGTPFARGAARHGLEPTGRKVVLGDGRGALHSTRLTFMERAEDGTLRPPRGPMEVAAWDRRRRWLGELPLLDRLCVEHYLLFAARRHRREAPRVPFPSAA